jgi:hypothetical protein
MTSHRDVTGMMVSNRIIPKWLNFSGYIYITNYIIIVYPDPFFWAQSLCPIPIYSYQRKVWVYLLNVFMGEQSLAS